MSRPTLTPNSHLMMRVLRDSGDQSRTSLSEVTGLSPTTVSKAVAPLIECGWVVEGGIERPASVGRPPIVVSPVADATMVCGVQIGVGQFRVGVADGRAKVVKSRGASYDTSDPVETTLRSVASLIKRVARESDAECLGIGVAVPGPVDSEHRINLMSINLGWKNVPVADRLEELVGLPVVVDHNVRAMALAEQRYGGHDVSSMAYVYVKTGVGLGLVLQGEPFMAGSHGISELGHIKVADPGLPCACGSSGCLETLVSEPALIAAIERGGVQLTAAEKKRLLATVEQRRDEPAMGMVREAMVGALARGLGAVTNLINPELIIMGGAFELAPQSLMDAVASAVREATFPLQRDETRFAKPSLAQAGVSAGAALALESFVYS